MSEFEFAYVAFAACGCLVGIGADMANEDTAEWVAEMIRCGGRVERMPKDDAKKAIVEHGFGCKCQLMEVVRDGN